MKHLLAAILVALVLLTLLFLPTGSYPQDITNPVEADLAACLINYQDLYDEQEEGLRGSVELLQMYINLLNKYNGMIIIVQEHIKSEHPEQFKENPYEL